MATLAPPPSLTKITVHAPGGLAYAVYVILALLYALVAQKLVNTSGEPYVTAMMQLDRIEATRQLRKGLEERSLLSLQAGLTKAADLQSFNGTLFDEGRGLLRSLRKRLDELTTAVEAGEPRPLAEALSNAIELAHDVVLLTKHGGKVV